MTKSDDVVERLVTYYNSSNDERWELIQHCAYTYCWLQTLIGDKLDSRIVKYCGDYNQFKKVFDEL